MIEELALSRIKDTGWRPEPGVYDVDFTAHIRGRVTVRADTKMRAAQKAKPWALLAVAMSKLNGVTIEALVREAENAPEAEIKARVQEALENIKGATVVTRRGDVIAELEVQCGSMTQSP